MSTKEKNKSAEYNELFVLDAFSFFYTLSVLKSENGTYLFLREEKEDKNDRDEKYCRF